MGTVVQCDPYRRDGGGQTGVWAESSSSSDGQIGQIGQGVGVAPYSGLPLRGSKFPVYE